MPLPLSLAKKNQPREDRDQYYETTCDYQCMLEVFHFGADRFEAFRAAFQPHARRVAQVLQHRLRAIALAIAPPSNPPTPSANDKYYRIGPVDKVIAGIFPRGGRPSLTFERSARRRPLLCLQPRPEDVEKM